MASGNITRQYNINLSIEKVVQAIGTHYSLDAYSANEQEIVLVVKKDKICKVLQELKSSNELRFKMLLSITATDNPGKDPRFAVIYELLSIEKNYRVRVKVYVNDGELVPSVSDIFSSAVWYEREVWDMYGILFAYNPDLRRILTDYGFSGHPLRKDFPLTGFEEVVYDSEKEAVVYRNVQLTQNYRNFDTLSPWEGPDYRLPGDEKADDVKNG